MYLFTKSLLYQLHSTALHFTHCSCSIGTYGYVQTKVAPLSRGAVAASQEGEEVAGKQSVELQEEVVDGNVQVQVQWLWS